MNIEISAAVSDSAGKTLYTQSHYIPEATQEQSDWLTNALGKALDNANKIATQPKEDNESYTVVFKMTGIADVTLTNLSYNAVVKQSNYWQQHVTGEILKVGEKVAKDKQKDSRRP